MAPRPTRAVLPISFEEQGPIPFETATVVHRANHREHIFARGFRVLREGNTLNVSPIALRDNITTAVPVTHGWIFQTDQGVLYQSDDFLGELRPLGRYGCGTIRTGKAPNAWLGIDDTRLLRTEGSAPITSINGPGKTLTEALFATRLFGVVIAFDGTVYRTTDGGAHWEQLRSFAGVAWKLAAPPEQLPGEESVLVYTLNGAFRVGTTSITAHNTPLLGDADTINRLFGVGELLPEEPSEAIQRAIQRTPGRYLTAARALERRCVGEEPNTPPPLTFAFNSDNVHCTGTALGPPSRSPSFAGAHRVVLEDPEPFGASAVVAGYLEQTGPRSTIMQTTWTGIDLRGPYQASSRVQLPETLTQTNAGEARQFPATSTDSAELGAESIRQAFAHRGGAVVQLFDRSNYWWMTPNGVLREFDPLFINTPPEFAEQFRISIALPLPSGGALLLWHFESSEDSSFSGEYSDLFEGWRYGDTTVLTELTPEGRLLSRRSFVSESGVWAVARVQGAWGFVRSSQEEQRSDAWWFHPLAGGAPRMLSWSNLSGNLSACTTPPTPNTDTLLLTQSNADEGLPAIEVNENNDSLGDPAYMLVEVPSSGNACIRLVAGDTSEAALNDGSERSEARPFLLTATGTGPVPRFQGFARDGRNYRLSCERPTPPPENGD